MKYPEIPKPLDRIARIRSQSDWSDELKEAHIAAHLERQKLIDERERDLEPVVAELRSVGFPYHSVWDVYRVAEICTDDYLRLVPVLLKHLKGNYLPLNLDRIARALAEKPAKIVWRELVDAYKSEVDNRDGIAIALSAIAMGDKELLPEVMELVQESEYGSSRISLLKNLTRSRRPEAVALVDSLAGDPDLKIEIAAIHKRRKKKK